MVEGFEIGEVASKCGITPRALRFYEDRGLIAPLRTAAGRRVYSQRDLTRLDAILALKRAGFTLQQIGEVLGNREIDLARLVALQLAQIDAQARILDDSRALLVSVQARLERGEEIAVDTVCSLIQAAESILTRSDWKEVVERYLAKDVREALASDLKLHAYDGTSQAAWRALGRRIAKRLPLEPTSREAQQFVDEWFALLKPFASVASPEAWNGMVAMYDDRHNWSAQPEMGLSHDVWCFIRAATQARLEAGGTVEGSRRLEAPR